MTATPDPDSPVGLRARIRAFLATQTAPVDSRTIREHLGLEPYMWLPKLNAALRSRYIVVTKAHPHVGTWPDGKPIYGATPISLYSLRAPTS